MARISSITFITRAALAAPRWRPCAATLKVMEQRKIVQNSATRSLPSQPSGQEKLKAQIDVRVANLALILIFFAVYC